MKITKKIETEILQVIDNYWDSYFQGDLQSWAAYLPEDYRNIGTTKAEIWNSKKEIVDFTESIIDQTVGMAEVRDKKTQIIPYDPYVMVHELGDLYVKAEEGWVFYAQFRLSSLLGKTKDGWKILHQHGSYPDSKTDEGEAFGFDELKAENKKLRDAIRARTIDLERKNRELEIESSLERVRAVAMSMKNSKELQAVSEVIFKELIALGCSDLRNAEIIINQDEKQSILSYYYSDYGVSGEIEVDYTSHPVLKKWADDMKTAGDGFASVHISEEEMEGWKQYRLDLGYLPDPKLENAKTLDYYSYSTGLGALSISSFKPISEEQVALLERFRNVFGLAYRRYADVVQAEAQAREAEIEAALERVRAKGLAMHHTDELEDIVHIVFEQLLKLAIPIGFSSIGINEYDSKELNIWIAAGDNIYTRKLHVPFIDHPIHTKILEALTNGVTFLSNIYSLEEMRGYYEHIFRHPEYRGFPEERKQLILSSRGYSRSAAISKYTTLAIGNYRAYTYSKEENEILKRFAKVFEQTYTRFLDLQKAEAQAREAQIEAALERVRARTMAMHNSQELREVVSVMYDNMESLGLAKWGVNIMICHEDSEEFEFWLAEETASKHTDNYFVKGREHPVYRKIWDHWEAKGAPLTLHHQDEYKREFDEYWLNKTDFKNLPDEVKASVFGKNEVFLNYATMRHGLLNAISYEQPSNELMEGLDRFAKVFEQAYTRFLDIQKAEAQAREAQIEAALERVRARTMAMHHTDELADATNVLFNEMRELGLDAISGFISLVNVDENSMEIWLRHGELMGKPTKVYGKDYPSFQNEIDAWKKQKPYLKTSFLKQDFINQVASVFNGKVKDRKDKSHFHLLHVRHKFGFLGLGSWNETSDNEIKLYSRFTNVFEQTYTRFLDLQKAETQAREAQIEAALERVRARAMAMHVSSELSEVVAYLYRELNQFGMGDWGCNIMIFNEEKDQIEIWLAESDQRVFDDSFKYRTKGHAFIEQQWNMWRKQRDENVSLSGKIKRSYDDYILENTDFKNLPAAIKDQIRSLEEIHFSFATMQYGMLAVIDSNKGLSGSEKVILKRFAKVFEQTYTRFLDLQKAEAQAREAQIEAALERVRSRSMAMHKSEELSDVANVLFEQLRNLGGNLWGTGFAFCQTNSDQDEFWFVNQGGTLPTVYIPNNEDPVHRKMYEGWKDKLDLYSKAKGGAELKAHYEYMLSVPSVKGFFQGMLDSGLSFPEWQKWHAAYFSHGYLLIITVEPYKEEQVFIRFAKVFDQAYTRFLDLQKAEAQAREAQIEAALERVRAKSMAMHKSEDLAELSLELVKQVQNLGIDTWFCAFNINDADEKGGLEWGSNGQGVFPKYRTPREGIFLEYYNAGQSGEELYIREINEEECPGHYEYLCSLPGVGEQLLEMKEAGIAFPTYQIDHVAFFKYGYILFITFEPVPESHETFKRFAKVFEQTYTRFLDLQRAEAQAREAEIEAALERVRAQTMAMHNSEDVGKSIVKMFEELTALGVPESTRFGIGILNQENTNNQLWTAKKIGEEVSMHIGNLDMTLHPLLESARKAWKKQVPLHKYVLEGEDLLNYYRMLNEAPDYKIQIAIEELPEREFHYGFVFEHGFFYAFSPREFATELIRITQRFSALFAQTYRRYLDLVKAEAQAREAKIEAGLERVRAASMAMHKSEDLHKVINLVYSQLVDLGLTLQSTQILDNLNDKHVAHFWLSNNVQEYSEQLHVPMTKNVFFTRLLSAIKNNESFFTQILSKRQKDDLSKLVFENAKKEDAPKSRQDFVYSMPGLAISAAIGKAAMLTVMRLDAIPYLPAENEIIKRFGKVFDQSYTRFLDLQKAEAQAREAEIELALERVRAKTMAMHNSEELLETGAILFKELSKLGVKIFNCGYVLMDDEAKMGWNYGVNPGDGTIRALPTGIPQSGTKVLDTITECWKKQEPLLVIELDPQETIEHQTYIAENAANFPLTKEQLLALTPEQLVIQTFNFKQGYLLLVDSVKLTTDQQEMVTRFANVFEMTYRRFLDLQKAEAQAREAQIEAAVERVRAEAMAMHSSKDFNQTAAVLWEQVNKLEVTGFAGAGIALFGEDGYITWYDFSSPGNIGSHEGNVNRYEYSKYPLLGKEVREVYQQGEPYFVFEYDLPKLKAAVKEWEVIKPSVAEGFKEAIDSGQLTQQWGACGRITNGFLFFDQLLPPDEDSRNILLKMTGAFELAYQRFLDLQKAEAQAREKEIQLGLEKVRARAMAMRHSDELADLVKTVFDELTKLDFAMQWCMINIIDEATRDNTIWAVNPDVDKAPQSYDIRFGDWPYHQASFKAYQERKTKFVYVLEGKEKAEFEEFMFNETDVANISEEAKAATRAMERYVHSYSFSDFGGLQTVSETYLSEESLDILARFGKVFDLTYTRFNDLKKAEAQAREAQIEAAMERVRARAMAMQKADELVEVATLLRKEMGLLGIEELETSSIYIHNKTTGKTECWYAIQDNKKEENLISDHMVIDLNDTWVGRQMLQFYQSDETKTSILMQGSNRTEWINYCAQHSDLFSVAEFYGAEVPERTYHLYKFSNGYMGAASPGAISDESWNLLQRATKVFSLAYTRFSDLQMAEAQAREAQIELALERGRTQSMLMQHSDELSDVSNVFHEQLLLLGLPSEFSYVWLPDEEKMTHMFWATWSEDNNGGITSKSKAYTYPLDKTEPYTAACYEMWESEDSVFVNRIQPEEVEDFFSTWAELVSEAETLKAELFPDGLYYAEAYMKYGCFGINIRRPLSKEEQDILLRFSVEFERAYTRFLDLKKAEAQTREAQIEAALERVRAQTMAMHDSEDVGQCIVKLFSELITLGVSENTRLGIGILNHDNEDMELWTASKDDDAQVKLDSGRIDMSRHPLLVSARNAWKENRRVDQYIIDGKEQVEAYFQIINTMPDYPLSVNMEKVPNRFVHYDFVFEQGILYAFSPEELSEEMIRIFQRFSALFGQTYRRFLDLQKAEAQAREAKIEAALERVRSRTMAMHKADELHDVVTVVVEKLVDLGVVLDANGVILCTYFPDSRDVLHWIASPDFSFSGSYLLPYFDHPIFSAAWESKLNGDDYFSKSFTVEEKNSFFEYAFEHSDYRHFPEEFKEWVFQNDKHSLSFAWSEHSAILIPSHTGVLPTEADVEILKRFAKVFEQAYVRFMDLQKAEKQAKEALKQAALDRVRGEIASMRSTEDLNRITPVIWRELIALEVPFIRCGVFIVNEESEVVEVYLTTPEGAALGVLNLPFDINSQTTNTVKYWREKKVYHEQWDAQAFTDWTQSMIDLGQVKDFTDYQGASKIPDELHLHFIPFKQGMLYVGDVNPLSDEKIEMVKTLAESFSIAYARYEDFVRLEQAKSEVEVTLEELKSTQAQLIQSEKMASLGELTAGIAHEIQNPLNFVNNFSEVSDEILDEMLEEIQNGDLEEVKAIAADIKQNLQKINHHGKRADAIVKGMLQHSRQSSGEKMPTDINLLADEYLRLAYHGLRAKDKSFNAAFETEFDPNLPMVKVIPQDLGRVLLNLINNAFQAVQEKSQSAVGHYAPKVSVQTSGASDAKSGSEEVIIKIRDNGPGIPDHIRDKIFQPFFTTKPTGQGTGLGLSLSYDIIKAHSGEIRVFSEEGKGTEFQISLPID